MNHLPHSATATAFVLAPASTSTSGPTLVSTPPRAHQITHSEWIAIRWIAR